LDGFVDLRWPGVHLTRHTRTAADRHPQPQLRERSSITQYSNGEYAAHSAAFDHHEPEFFLAQSLDNGATQRGPLLGYDAFRK